MKLLTTTEISQVTGATLTGKNGVYTIPDTGIPQEHFNLIEGALQSYINVLNSVPLEYINEYRQNAIRGYMKAWCIDTYDRTCGL